MDYNSFVSTMQTMLVIKDPVGIANLNAILPQMIAYAELRIYREPSLDFLATRTSDASQTTTSGVRRVNLLAQFLVVEGVSLIIPANTPRATTLGAKRLPLLRATRQFLDMIWPEETLTQTPDLFTGGYWALFNEEEDTSETPYNLPNSILIAPTPDNQYNVEVTGTFRPAPLSSTTPNTVLTEYFPDLFLSAAMIFGAGYQRDFGAQTDDPKLSVTWESQYQAQLIGASVESARQKAQSWNYTAEPKPLAELGPPPAPAPTQ